MKSIYQFPKKESFKYWFENNQDNSWWIYCLNPKTDSSIGMLVERNELEYDISPITINNPSLKLNNEAISKDFEMFKQRPEYYVYNFKNVYPGTESAKDMYSRLMLGCIFLRTSSDDPDNLIDKVDNMFQWIDNTDFYSAPASTRFHGCVPGGLVDHTLKVVYIISLLAENIIWQEKVKLEDAVLVALVHDWCKINLYESYTKNVKNPNTGQWESEIAYKYRDEPMSCFGHGVSSLFLAQKSFKLSKEEALAIRWHMGEYNVADNEMNDLHQANETYPLVQLLQFADRLSITKYV